MSGPATVGGVGHAPPPFYLGFATSAAQVVTLVLAVQASSSESAMKPTILPLTDLRYGAGGGEQTLQTAGVHQSGMLSKACPATQVRILHFRSAPHHIPSNQCLCSTGRDLLGSGHDSAAEFTAFQQVMHPDSARPGAAGQRCVMHVRHEAPQQ